METAAEILISALLKIGNSEEYTIEMIKNDPEYRAIIEVIESLQEENRRLRKRLKELGDN